MSFPFLVISPLSILFFGFFLGMRHATDADHVVAVSTFVTRQRSVRRALAIGSIWGIGHTLSIVLVGGAIIMLGIVMPPRVGLSLEFGVALMLIVIGLMNLERFVRWLHDVVHLENAATVAMAGGGAGRAISRQTPETIPLGNRERAAIARPLVVGLVHGLAGSAALTLLVIPVIQHPGLAIAYLFMFGIGSIAGMMVITAGIAWPCARFSRKSSTFGRRLSALAAFASIALGLFLVYEIGFVQGLFSLQA